MRCPRVRDRGGAGEAGKIRFTSAILPPYLRRAKSIEELLPWLYLKGISTGDFTERNSVDAQIKLSHQSLYDDLTGLANRALFLDRLEQAIAVAKRDDRQVALLIMDLNRFRDINRMVFPEPRGRRPVAAGRGRPAPRGAA